MQEDPGGRTNKFWRQQMSEEEFLIKMKNFFESIDKLRISLER